MGANTLTFELITSFDAPNDLTFAVTFAVDSVARAFAKEGSSASRANISCFNLTLRKNVELLNYVIFLFLPAFPLSAVKF